jgi:hypothetical protein
VRGQLNFYIFLYFPSKNLIKTDVIWMKSWILVFCLGSVLNFNYYLFKRCDIWVKRKQNNAGLLFLEMTKSDKTKHKCHSIFQNICIAPIDKGFTHINNSLK